MDAATDEISAAVAFLTPLRRCVGKALGTTGIEACFSGECAAVELALEPRDCTVGTRLGVAALIHVIGTRVCCNWIRGILVHGDAGGNATAPLSLIAIASGGLALAVCYLGRENSPTEAFSVVFQARIFVAIRLSSYQLKLLLKININIIEPCKHLRRSQWSLFGNPTRYYRPGR